MGAEMEDTIAAAAATMILQLHKTPSRRVYIRASRHLQTWITLAAEVEDAAVAEDAGPTEEMRRTEAVHKRLENKGIAAPGLHLVRGCTLYHD